MVVEVTRDSVVISEYSVINTGEFCVNECEFILPDCFEGLNVTAVFNNIPVPLVGNKCLMPSLEKGRAVLGVYAYREGENGVEIMYSPRTAVFNVSQGSFSEEVNEEAVPEISIYEQYCKMIVEHNKLISSSLVNAINENSTNEEIPTAKAVYDFSVEKNDILQNYDPSVVPNSNNVYSANAILEMKNIVMKDIISKKEDASNKTTIIDGGSTDEEYPTAKTVYDFGVMIHDLTYEEIEKEIRGNVEPYVDNESTHEKLPTAKAVYDFGFTIYNNLYEQFIGNLENVSALVGGAE